MTSESSVLPDSLGQRVEQLLREHPVTSTGLRDFLAAQFDLGLAWVANPPALGGCDAPASQQGPVVSALIAAGAPRPFAANPIGYGMAAPTLMAYAGRSDLERFLRPLFCGDEIWCQLFSEPSAGSDVAALATRAVRDGDEWVVNGQKVWTSLAHEADWGLLLTRSDPALPKHAGLTYFFVDMHAPGVEVRPLRQASGDAEFNEVYFTDVRVPDVQRLGEVGDGWKVALTTLMNERVSIGGVTIPRGAGPIGEALAIIQEHGCPPESLDRFMQLWVRTETLRLTNERARETGAGGQPGPEGSIGKLVAGELAQDVYLLCMELLGPDGMLFPETYAPRRRLGEGPRDVRYNFLRSLANTIEGGTSEVMRNILGERVLGLPGPPRLDKHVPWNTPTTPS
jgi:alkylation response protein AidB-like acyl-CoA dehydrogenase